MAFLLGEEPGSGSHCHHTMGPAGPCEGRGPRLVGPDPDLNPDPSPHHNLDPDPLPTHWEAMKGSHPGMAPRGRGGAGRVIMPHREQTAKAMQASLEPGSPG